ncbi:phytanoyl-dioxygenase family protein [Xylariaceae sp. FL0804]|nr:phytanoyl-dioxygenase family protein [Xylariaceae sp. FL0804]
MFSSGTDPSTLRSDLARDGFVVQRAVLTPAELAELRGAAERTTARARAGEWPDVRTVGKQFPPWPGPIGPGGIWGVQALLHPDQPDAAVFARSYFGEGLMGIATALLSSSSSSSSSQEKDDDDDLPQLVMELYNLLVRPDADFDLEWHRDDVPRTATPAEEEARLHYCRYFRPRHRHGEGDGEEAGPPPAHAQWNLALFEDASLVVVPGSHRRARTKAEREAEPREAHLPGELVVELGPGDVVFYDNNILHRGVYDAKKERMSLHGSVGRADVGSSRARNVLQHGVGAWVDRCDFSALGGEGEPLRRRAEGMRARLVELGRRSGDVGYSLSG